MADATTFPGSRHFTRAELECPHCHACSVSAKLVLALDELREKLGAPLVVLSGYRCSIHNLAVGGAKSSEHTQGKAADVRAPGVQLAELLRVAQTVQAFSNGGIGVYPPGPGNGTGFLHLDVRETKARWARIGGKYVAFSAGVAAIKA